EIGVGVPAADGDARIVDLKNRAERSGGIADYQPVATPETGHRATGDETDDNGEDQPDRDHDAGSESRHEAIGDRSRAFDAPVHFLLAS
ncbi:hypothetical protein, partial [Nitrolancea hollandica]|uniref:hypothetical protein n=1 Tax=Nitrolancea hollandica TaxID=1206749 RepID=UPI00135F14F1